ncbi:MAG: hypothetical protein UX41_C0017G0005 [Candidatus Collierbacteria bacterium GW2011_GWE1_46_18]|uniref:POTRA domain-containing protein n=1 Tax=Candidatus Collierbacteria bacterium GW2011_GWE1_46_18 TaxID=1618399 RepID=A0A0G1P9J2_9BACT|nr:MAG: hypothetical protein UX41_C0017G0005 [Candidatus Collierbacteria bacterium GW2011_GWE1_46_18]
MLQKRSSVSSTNISKRSFRRVKAALHQARSFVKLIPFLAVLIIFLFFGAKALTIQKINCRVNGRVCPREVEGILWHLSGDSYFKINRRELHWAIKQIFPLDELKYNFSYPNTLEVSITGVQEAYPIASYQVPQLPNLSLDMYGSSSESAQWSRPVPEIESFATDLEWISQKLWENGSLTTDVSSESGFIKHIFTSIPSENHISSMYKIIALSYRYLENPKIYILDDRIFLSQENLPDIIIYVDSPLTNVESSLQSLDYLVTIKKDIRVLNLSFKHPILK